MNLQNIKYELALFAGAGGGLLGGKLCGLTPVGAVELDPYCVGVLLSRQNEGYLPPFPIWDDVRTFRADNPECAEFFRFLRSIRHELVISGGFPCQDISTSGKGAGLHGPKSRLWYEFHRIIWEVGCRCVLVENSPALTLRGLDTILGQMATLGYHVAWGVLGAYQVGAPHYRRRIWLVAYADGIGQQKCTLPQSTGRINKSVIVGTCGNGAHTYSESGWPESTTRLDTDAKGVLQETEWPENTTQPAPVCGDGTHTNGQGRRKGQKCRPQQKITQPECGSWWEVEPQLGRVAHGVANRVGQVRALGNGQVPGVVQQAWYYLNYLIEKYSYAKEKTSP